MTTIKDVARLAGVGIGTASRVINKSGYASQETKEKVLAAIQQLGYVPNETARAFVTQDSRIVALFLPSIHHAFFSELAFYIEDELDNRGYKMMLCNSAGRIEKEIEYINMLKQNKVSGIIGISYNDIEDEVSSTMPIVLVDRHLGEIPYVASDNYSGGKIALDILKNTGCKQVAYIGTYSDLLLTEVEKRKNGFRDRAIENGLNPIIYVEKDPISNQTEFLENFLKQNKSVDGVLVENDHMALELMQIAIEKEIKIPEELSIIGYDGVQTYDALPFQISSIRQPVELMGRSLVELLINRINGIPVASIIHPVKFLKGKTSR